ncbi:MAG TPA: VTT domain-containing protein [Terriglobales bacterium]|nr:VTT domain-containing protein [Terriglobales bacterium]
MTTLHWLRRLGGPGLVLLGIADSSIIPLAGSMDVLTILLAAHRPTWWPYYAVMATLGSMIGSYITYVLASKGGKQALERRLSCDRVNKIYKKFEEHGFLAVMVPALLPPPFPFVPFILAAGAMQYARKKFLGALALGRGIRFSVLACLGAVYGRHITKFFAQYYKPALAILGVLAAVGMAAALIQYFRHRRDHSPAAA